MKYSVFCCLDFADILQNHIQGKGGIMAEMDVGQNTAQAGKRNSVRVLPLRPLICWAAR